MPDMQPIPRRRLLRTSAIVSAGYALALRPRSAAAPNARILSTEVISMRPHLYHGWPTLTRRSDGELLVVGYEGTIFRLILDGAVFE